jgi:hypothetical protein
VEEGRDGGESDRIDICVVPGSQPVPDAVCGVQSTFSVIAEAHLGLAEADCIFPLADAIELLELGLIDALHIESVHALHVMGWWSIGGNLAKTNLTWEVDLKSFDADILGP